MKRDFIICVTIASASWVGAGLVLLYGAVR